MEKLKKEVYLPNWLIIAGTGQKVGKTTLACNIISKFSPKQNIIGVKICPHFHPLDPNEKILVKNDHFIITQESLTQREKDSSKMLSAGANKVFYIQVLDDSLNEAFNGLLTLLHQEDFVVCESGGLRKLVKPGIFLICHSPVNLNIKESAKLLIKLADSIISLEDNGQDKVLNQITIDNNQWKLIQ